MIVGVSKYTAGWPSLESIPSELENLEVVLKSQGFKVEKYIDPDSVKLKSIFENFIDKFGYDKNNRLLFYYSGHGHTRIAGTKGYLVPADAPVPRNDERGFLRKALPMSQILEWSRRLEAKHALFLFDSCFFGTIFATKEMPKSPPHISRATELPVRQFITAGDAGETVPSKSVFTPVFIDALKYKWGDLNKDGYISGTELGLYLQSKVPEHTNQTPQYGKIQDYELARGDFIFILEKTKKRNSNKQGTLLIESRPSGGKVLIDGSYQGKTPVEVKGLLSGRKSIVIRMQGYNEWSECKNKG